MKKVLILFGGNSFEHDISIKSVNFILDNIDKSLFNYSLVGVDQNNIWYSLDNNSIIDSNWLDIVVGKIDNIIEYSRMFDIVFPIIHGNTCEDGKLQSLFELYNIKYVGSNSYSSLISYDKYLTKLVLDGKVKQIPYIISDEIIDIDYPVIVKPSKCGSSIGISVAYTEGELKKSISNAKKYDDVVIIEKYIKNRRELECAILESGDKIIVSDVGEIVVNDGWYDYDSKYVNSIDTMISNIDNRIKEQVRKYAYKVFKLLKCSDYARVDFLYDVDNDILYFNEINTIPGFTKISMYPKLINNCNISYKELISILLNNKNSFD